jgi:hypothetical protein
MSRVAAMTAQFLLDRLAGQASTSREPRRPGTVPAEVVSEQIAPKHATNA